MGPSTLSRFLFAAAICLFLRPEVLAGQAVRPDDGKKTAAAQVDPSPAAGRETRLATAPGISVRARTIDRDGEKIFATGDVEIETGTLELFADYVEYDLRTEDATATGNVVILVEGEALRAERARLNLGSGAGELEQATGLMQPTFIFEADRLERSSSARLKLEKARFTLCTQPVPRWSFSVGKARLDNDGYLVLKNAVFRIKKVPVFFLPYLRYPLEKQRATGFLMPRFGTSGSKGAYVSQSFYLALRPNMDATVGVDLYSSKGVGAALEYRYIFSDGTKGQVNLYQFWGKKTSDDTGLLKASIIRLNHNQDLPGGFKLAADVDYQTSFTFTRDYDDDFRRAVTANRSRQVVLSRAWSNFSFSARVSSYETYFSELDDTIVNKTLPQINFNVFKVKVLSGVYFSLNSSYNNYEYGWSGGTGGSLPRRMAQFRLQPALIFPLTSLPWLTASVTAGGNFTSYSKSLDPATGLLAAVPLTTLNGTLKVDLTGPVFYRIFFGRSGGLKTKHIIEPFFQYAYDSPIDDPERIYTTSGYSRLHQLTYGLTNRLLVKSGDGQAREVLVLSISRTSFFSPESGPLRGYLVDGHAPRMSEMTTTLRYYPAGEFFLDASAGYNPYSRRFSTFRLSAGAGSKQEGNFISVNWLKSENAWIAGIDPVLLTLSNRHEASVYSGLKVPALDLDLQADASFNILTGRFRYTGGRLVYHYQCVDFQLDFGVYHYRTVPETQVKFSIGLGSISRAAEFLNGLGF